MHELPGPNRYTPKIMIHEFISENVEIYLNDKIIRKTYQKLGHYS